MLLFQNFAITAVKAIKDLHIFKNIKAIKIRRVLYKKNKIVIYNN